MFAPLPCLKRRLSALLEKFPGHLTLILPGFSSLFPFFPVPPRRSARVRAGSSTLVSPKSRVRCPFVEWPATVAQQHGRSRTRTHWPWESCGLSRELDSAGRLPAYFESFFLGFLILSLVFPRDHKSNGLTNRRSHELCVIPANPTILSQSRLLRLGLRSLHTEISDWSQRVSELACEGGKGRTGAGAVRVEKEACKGTCCVAISELHFSVYSKQTRPGWFRDHLVHGSRFCFSCFAFVAGLGAHAQSDLEWSTVIAWKECT